MILWQFDLFPSDLGDVSGTASVNTDLLTSIGIGIAALVGFVLICAFILQLVRMHLRARRATFEHVTMLVTRPKFRHDEESQRGPEKEKVQEAIASAEAFFSSIGGLKAEKGFMAWLRGRGDEFAFEIVAHEKLIRFYTTVPRTMQSYIEQQILSAWPDASVELVEDYNMFAAQGVILGSYLVLKREHAFPIKTYKKLDTDPLNALTNVLSRIPESEGAAFQFLVRSAPAKWRSRGVAIARHLQQGMTVEEALSGKKKGKKSEWLQAASATKDTSPEKDHRLSPLEEEIVKGLEEKASKAGMDVCIRVVVSGRDVASAQQTLGNMLNAFSQYNIYQYGNTFAPHVPRSKNTLTRQFIYRQFDEKRSMVLNTEELASLWHLPLPWTETPSIQWLSARRAPAPSNAPDSSEGDLQFGYNLYRGVKTPVWIKKADRQRHVYIIGKSGTGKSQLIAQMAIQDIKKGHGVAIVDPHGDLIEQILGNIPKERVDDVIHFNPSDIERPMGMNMLEARDESLKDFAVQEMIAIFYKLFGAEMIGPIFEHTMRNVMLTLMADQENPGTLAEIPRILSDEEYAKTWVAKVKDPVVKAFWEKEMAKMSDFHKSEQLGYLISKVGRFVENEMMRNIIGQSHSSFDFRDVMDQQKILLVNLSKGKTGDVNAELLGLVVVSKLQMAALSRADMDEENRKDFYLYIDEFQNFITDSIATILSEARKYRLDLTIAHQYIGQLVKNNDTKIKDAVFGNVGTMFTARIGPEDVEVLEKVYAPDFTGYDLINSDKLTWYVKMIIDNASAKPFTLNFDMAPRGDRGLAEAVKELSRLKYGRDREIVQAEIMERTQLGAAEDVGMPGSEGREGGL